MSDAGASQSGGARAGGSRVRGAMRSIRMILMLGVPLAALAVLGWFWITGGRYQQTDNAYVQAARVPVSASINGRIVEMRVGENERVETGQVLFTLDKASFESDVRAAEAAFASACTHVAALKAAYGARLASRQSAEEALSYARSEAERTRRLAEQGIAPREDLDARLHDVERASTALDAAEQAAAEALAALGGDAEIAVEEHPLVREAAARLERARLAASYTEVVAPQAGVVTRVDQVQVGSYVNAGQTLFWLIAGEPWIEANFKESQLENMQVGQSAQVHIDAYPRQVFEARVASFSPGTGAVFAALPAQNATGNWVKVVQRLTVRLAFVDPPAGLDLRAGLSARARVDTGAPDAPEGGEPAP